ncbi:EPM2A-interacting protein 1-like [Leptinotarsa decemlineata]|uniref:EPM2A-interacting protein 1-like n=1 Tax=Leptinotarsa decemlineata TaxID=7539 RepID=UPI003D30D0EA
MIRGGNRSLLHRQLKQFLVETEAEYGDLLMYNHVRWLSAGKCMERFFAIRKEIPAFLNKYVSSDTTELEEKFKDPEFLRQLAFITDLTNHLNKLNLSLQGRNQTVSDLIGMINGFRNKLNVFKRALEKNNLTHFPSCLQIAEEFNEEQQINGAPVVRIRWSDGEYRIFKQIDLVAQALNGLPGMDWEEFEGPAIPPARPARMAKLSRASYDFWVEEQQINGAPVVRIRWSDGEYRIFKQIVQSMASKKGFNVTVDLSIGQGTLAQTVQTMNWSVDRSIQWFVMTDISEHDQKLGAAFSFCSYEGNEVQHSRFKGSFTTSYWRGEITPRRVMNAIVASQE